MSEEQELLHNKHLHLQSWKLKPHSDDLRWSLCSSSYQYAVILLIYLLPLLVMLVTYSIVGQSLWGGHIPGEATDHYHNQMTAKRKVTRFHSAISQAVFRCELSEVGVCVCPLSDLL